MSRLNLQATLQLTDMISRPLKNISDRAKQLQQELKSSANALKQLHRTMGNANALKTMRDQLKQVKKELKSTAETEKALSAAIAASQNPTKAQLRNLEQVRKTLKQLSQTQDHYRQEMRRVGQELRDAGFNTKKFADSQKDIESRTRLATIELERQRQELKRLTDLQRQASTARQQYSASKQHANNMQSNGMAMIGAGVATAYSLKKPIEETKKWDTEVQRVAALGFGKKTTDQAVKYAQEMKTFGTSTVENLELLRDGMTIFSDLHHAEMVNPTLAKMKFSNKAMFGHEKGEENERAFMDMLKVIELRGGLKSEKSFQDQANKIQQVITATGGRVQGGEWLNAIKTGGLAVKGLTDEALYYKMESIVQEFGGFRYGTAAMSAYQNLYQGRTTKRAANNMLNLGLISDSTKLKHDKAGQVSFLDVGAIKGAELFRKDQFAWMEQVLIPTLASKGITSEKGILDAIGSIFTNRTASNLFSTMYQQRDIINKSAKMNAGADNINQLYAKAKTTGAGQELETKAKLHDAYLKFGTQIMPIYIQALNVATSALQGLTIWMEKHPKLTKAIGVSLMGLAVGMIVFGSLALIIGSILIPLISLRLGFKLLKIAIIGNVGSALSLISAFAKLGLFLARLQLTSLAVAFRLVGQAILFVGRTLLMTPIGWIIMGIALAALLIYKYWQPLKAFFTGVFQGLQQGLAPLLPVITTIFQGISALFAPLKPIFDWFVGILSLIFQWFSELLTPVKLTSEELKNATSAGEAFGLWIASGITNFVQLGATIINYLVTPIRGWIELINTGISLLNKIPGLNLPTAVQIPSLRLDQLPTQIQKTQPVKTQQTKAVIPFSGSTAPVSNHFAAPNINISGVTDPKQIATIVDQKLKQHQSSITAQQQRKYSDKD